MKRWIATSFLVTSLAGYGCAGSGDETPDETSEDASTRTPASYVQIVGGGARERALFRAIITRGDARLIKRVELLQEGGRSPALSPAEGRRPFVRFVVAVSEEQDRSYGIWQAMVIAGAANKLLGRASRPSGFAVAGSSSRGELLSLMSIPATPPFTLPRGSLSVEKASERLSSRARKLRVSLRRVQSARPLGTSLFAQVSLGERLDDFRAEPGRYLQVLSEVLVDPDRPLIDGLYLQFETDNGEVVRTAGYATRMRIGSGWINRKFARTSSP